MNCFRIIVAGTLLWGGAVHAAELLFRDLNVIPMDREVVLSGHSVIVRDGRIAWVGPDAETPALTEDAILVAGSGRYLLPGFAEMHAHVPAPSQGEAYLDRVLALFVARGVTTIRGMLGHPAHLALRAELAADRLGPRLFTSGPSFNGRSVSGAADARMRVERQHAAGYDFLKIHPGLSKAEYDAVAQAARQLRMPFSGHVPGDVGVAHALAAGQAAIDHLDGYMQTLLPSGDTDSPVPEPGFFGFDLAMTASSQRIGAIAKATADAGTWTVATQALIEHVLWPTGEIADWPEMQYMPSATVAAWRRAHERLLADPAYAPAKAERFIALRRQLIRALQRSGAGLLLGSDAPQQFNVPGFSTHRELELLVAAGLSPYEALRSATAAPAVFFEAQGDFGTIQVGAAADLLLLDANPMEDIRNTQRIAGVMVHGRWLPASRLASLLAAWSRTNNSQPDDNKD